ncbi:MAG: IPT/TIG domain-containing protein [Acidobacteriaceae bacterium]
MGNGAVTVQGVSGSLTHSMTVNTAVTAAIAFQLNVSPSTVTIGPNGQASAQVTLVPGSNFGSNSVSLSFPSVHVGNTGVDMSLSSTTLTAAQPQATVAFQSGFEVQTGSFPVALTGTLGAQVVHLPLTLNINNPAQACNSLSRSTVRRTDMDTTGVVYDPVHKLVFAAVQQTNTLGVFSPTTAQTVSTIPIPAPWQLDIAPDGSRILVGTFTNYLYWVDPVSLRVAGRLLAEGPLEAGNLGIFAPPLIPVILASGKVLVSTGTYQPKEWDPATGAWSDPTPSGFGSQNTLMRRSGDHSKVVVATTNGLAIFNSATDSYGPVQHLTVSTAALNFDGSRLAVLTASPTLPGGVEVTLFDPNFGVLATYQLNSDSDAVVSMDDVVFSRDGSTLFVLAGNSVTALSAADLSFLGETPSAGFSGVTHPSDIDENNMIFSPGSRTTNFIDAGSPCAVGVDLPFNMALTPPQATLNTASPVTLTAAGGITAQSKVYFGAAPGSPNATPGTNLSPNPPTSILVTAPASQAAGAVNITVTNPDGSLGIAPDAFSYGSSVLALSTSSGPPTGGTPVTLYGYGLAFDQSEIQVTVGGNAATVTRAFAGAGFFPFPFPMDQVTFTTPAGNPGPADVVVTTPAGIATVAGGFHYLQGVQSYPASSALAQAVYDRSRQRLYAADAGSNVVDVFDASKQQFLAPITVGNSPQALALSPDLNTLVVSNGADATVSIIDLTGLNPARTVSVAGLPNQPAQCGQPVPYAVAVSSTNKAIIALTCLNLTAGELIVLDLATHSIGCGASQGCAAMLAAFPQNLDQAMAISGSGDGNSILVQNAATLGRWDVSGDTFLSQDSGEVEFPVVQSAADSDGTAFALVYGMIDPNLNLFSMMQDADYLQTGIYDVNRLPGEKLHPSGALLYYPDNNGFGIYDVHRGRLTTRVVLPQQIAVTFDAMAIDDTGSQVFLLTTTGLTVVNIADLPLSIGNLQPAKGSASGGTTVVVRGSGFQNGAQVFFNDTSAGVEFVDGSTLKVTSPAVSAGAVRITVVNPNGSHYSLDDSFTAQ